jgi:hypothetical protein
MRIGKPIRASRHRPAAEAEAEAETEEVKAEATAEAAATTEDAEVAASSEPELRRTNRKRMKTKLYGEEVKKASRTRQQRLAAATNELLPNDDPDIKLKETAVDELKADSIDEENEEKANDADEEEMNVDSVVVAKEVRLSDSNLSEWAKLKEERELESDDAVFEYLSGLHRNRSLYDNAPKTNTLVEPISRYVRIYKESRNDVFRITVFFFCVLAC